MALKHYRPMTPGTRQLVLVDRSELYKGKPVKALTEGLNKTGGRNNFGNITSWQRGGGHKRRYRLVDFKRRKFDVPGKVERLEYDPNRTAFIALITYADGEQAYIIAPQPPFCRQARTPGRNPHHIPRRRRAQASPGR